jgi:hypothetical protein
VPALSYRRVDQVVRIATEPPLRAGGPEWVMVTGPGGATWTTRRRAGVPLRLGGLARALEPLPPAERYGTTVERVLLHVPPALAREAWEQALARWAVDRVIVRVTPVPPPYSGRPLALPLRIAEIALPGAHLAGRPPNLTVARVVESVTRRARAEFPVAAVETMAGASTRLDAALRRRGWPTLDALQLDGSLPETGLLDPGPDAPPGSLGWIERLAGLYQVRLVVLPVEESQLADARGLAARLLERGGPAVVVAPPSKPGALAWSDLRWVYIGLVHDLPLDVAVQVVSRAELHAGVGREDALRVSAGIQQVVERTIDRRAGFEAAVLPRADRVWIGSRDRGRLGRGADALVTKWPTLDFDREGGGLYPSAKAIEPVTRVLARAISARRNKPKGRAAREPRFVNATLFEAGPRGAADEVSVDSPPLLANANYVLSVDVGRLAERVQAAGALELLVEDQLWEEEGGGLWMELGVAGLGCTVIGASVQPLWVPRYGPSEPRHVLVRMGRPGIAVLRYTLYHRTHVVQSFRLATVVARRRGVRVTDAHRRKLAAALDLEFDEVGERTWYARLEFSTVARVEQAAALPERSLALVVNDVAGTPMITVKGRGDLAVSIPTDIGGDVKSAREAMNKVSGAGNNDYAFGFEGDVNATNDAHFSEVLGLLAQAGWALRSRVLTIGYDAENEKKLAEPGGVIQVAHVIRDKVVPWALVYDKPYNAGRKKVRGRRVDHVACTASLPQGDGTLRVTTCGTDPACQLHPKRLAERDKQGLPTLLRETVACPLGFWGVRHQIELPPRQVLPGQAPLPAIASIAAPAVARVMLGFNVRLKTRTEHQKELEKVLAKARRGGPPKYIVTDRNDVIDAFEDADLDVAYLYCHAEGGEPDGPVPPRLLFQDPQVGETPPGTVPPPPKAWEVITPSELPQVTWAHNPLVILNGCGTTGFSAHGTSQFIAELVDRRQAAAVVGADVPVAENLASEVGLALVGAVVDGMPLGDALQLARRKLLSRRNPLGLVYTLYGSVGLKLS